MAGGQLEAGEYSASAGWLSVCLAVICRLRWASPLFGESLPSAVPSECMCLPPTLQWLQGPAAGLRSKLFAGPLLHSAAASYSEAGGLHLSAKSKFEVCYALAGLK